MKRTVLPLLISLCVIISCSSPHVDHSPDFDAFKSRFIEAYWQMNPTSASSAGYHKHDDLLPAYDVNIRTAELNFAKTYLDSLDKFDVSKLDALNKTDHLLIGNALRGMQFYNDTFRAWQWDPSGYNVAGAFADIVNANNLEPAVKYKLIGERLKQVPAYYAAAQQNISNPTEVHTKLAIEQSEGTISYFKNELTQFCASHGGAGQSHSTLIADAIKAIEGYRSFLSSAKFTQHKDFRIGAALYERKFQFDIQSASTAAEMCNKALNRKSEVHKDMFAITQQLWSKYFKEPIPSDTLKAISMMINRVSVQHVHRDSFMQAIEQQIPELTAFVKEKDLLYMDPSKSLKVRRTPAYMDGVAGASINAPGPYDKDAETYYNVSTLEKMSAAQAESYLREYNYYVLQILNIHEAIPGHYVQLVYANKAPSLVKTIFGNGAMIEGWAVYAERMMLENGYGNNAPEMQLMYSKWHLRTVCNTILDYSVHVKGWNEQQAKHLLVDEAFQQEAEAAGKWRRVSVSQVQLCSYFTGYSEIFELREALKKEPGFNLKQFHEQFLSYGSAPVKAIRQLMVK